ncbi:MAG: AraC family transcriptional regulator [Ruminiclostridium sp.]
MAIAEAEKEFRLENVLSLKKIWHKKKINSEMIKIGKFLQYNELKKAGSIITATFAIETQNGQPLLDMEILVPIDKKIELPREYVFKPVFHIVNAIYARHEGNPKTFQNTYNDMLTYIQQNKLQQLTAGYNVQVKDLMSGVTPDDMVVDVYIGVNPNTL